MHNFLKKNFIVSPPRKKISEVNKAVNFANSVEEQHIARLIPGNIMLDGKRRANCSWPRSYYHAAVPRIDRNEPVNVSSIIRVFMTAVVWNCAVNYSIILS